MRVVGKGRRELEGEEGREEGREVGRDGGRDGGGPHPSSLLLRDRKFIQMSKYKYDDVQRTRLSSKPPKQLPSRYMPRAASASDVPPPLLPPPDRGTPPPPPTDGMPPPPPPDSSLSGQDAFLGRWHRLNSDGTDLIFRVALTRIDSDTRL